MRLVFPFISLAWGVGMVLLALARPRTSGSGARLATRVFGWSTAITASAIALAEWGRSQGPSSALVITGCALAVVGAILLLALRNESSALKRESVGGRRHPTPGRAIGAAALVLAGDASIVASSRAGDYPVWIAGLSVGVALFVLAGLSLRRRAGG